MSEIAPVFIAGLVLVLAGAVTALIFGVRMLLALGKKGAGAGMSFLKCLGGGALTGVGAAVALMGTEGVEISDPKEAPAETPPAPLEEAAQESAQAPPQP